jgi:hypothetical protein
MRPSFTSQIAANMDTIIRVIQDPLLDIRVGSLL